VQFKRDTVKQHIERMEQWVEEVFKTIIDSTKGESIPTDGNIEKITQAMEAYRVHIADLTDLLSPTTLPEVRTQREKNVTSHT
jgi:hypothetical protein